MCVSNIMSSYVLIHLSCNKFIRIKTVFTLGGLSKIISSFEIIKFFSYSGKNKCFLNLTYISIIVQEENIGKRRHESL